MMNILKYKLFPQSEQTLIIPSPQRFLSIQLQYNDICVWYEVNAKPAQEDFDTIFFMIVGTGPNHSVPENSQYLGTIQSEPFVWHIYARRAT